MEVPFSAPESAETLAAVGHRIHTVFATLEADNQFLTRRDSFQASLSNESQRYDLWARNVGLYKDGDSSLDYRFRDTPSIYDYTRHLLGKLEQSLLISTSTPCPTRKVYTYNLSPVRAS